LVASATARLSVVIADVTEVMNIRAEGLRPEIAVKSESKLAPLGSRLLNVVASLPVESSMTSVVRGDTALAPPGAIMVAAGFPVRVSVPP